MSCKVELSVRKRFVGKIHLLGQPFQIARVNEVGWPRLAIAQGHLCQIRTEAIEFVQVGLEEQQMRPVQRVQVAIQKLAGEPVIERAPRELPALQQAGRGTRDVNFGWYPHSRPLGPTR